MAPAEFSVIDRYFSGTGAERDDVLLGVGDDAALLHIPANQDLVVAVSTWLSGNHFDSDTDPSSLAHKCLTAALNRLAASAAQPAWITLTLAMPRLHEPWLAALAAGLDAVTRRYGIRLVGGDTTQGPLRITLHAHGLVPSGMAPKPHLARSGDLVYVTGTLGDAGLALLDRQRELVLPARARTKVQARVDQPEPRVSQGIALRGLARAAVSVSDGLASDLAELLRASGVGASLTADSLPISPEMAEHLPMAGGWALPLTAPGDCELCFTVSPAHQAELEARFADLDVGCSWIGTVEQRPGLRCLLEDGTDIAPG